MILSILLSTMLSVSATSDRKGTMTSITIVGRMQAEVAINIQSENIANGLRVVTIEQTTSGFADAGIVNKKFIVVGWNSKPLLVDAQLPAFVFNSSDDVVVLEYNTKNLRYAKSLAKKNFLVRKINYESPT